MPNTKISLQTFKTITATDGTFSTWTDIIQTAMRELPLNTEILGAPFKSLEEVGVGENVEFKNISTKFIETYRTELDENNKLEFNKMIMFINDDFMAPFEYSILDQKSASEWAALVSGSINQMFISKQDVANMLALDEIQKIALALGEFTIVTDGDKLPKKQDGSINWEAYKMIGHEMVYHLIDKSRQRTKFSKGIDPNRIKWVNNPKFGLNLLMAQTNNYSGSDRAYGDQLSKDRSYSFYGTDFTQSIYLGDKIGMNEFKVAAGKPSAGTKQNAGSWTGNIVKPFDFEHILSLAWIPDSVLYYGHNLTETDVPAINNRNTRIMTFAWRAQVAILPILAQFNHLFITKLPTIPGYTDKSGNVIAAYNLNTYNEYVNWKKKIREQQPMLYSALIDADGYTSNGVKDSGAWTKWITANTLTWK